METLKVIQNKSKRIFTIKTEIGKYRTFPFSKTEFNDADYWTNNDWKNFLKTNNYYLIK